MRRALLVLTASEPAIFSTRAATEGQHDTLRHPTGAALLGWAAGGGRYDRFADPFTIFHSGLVRFSNALPVTDSRCVAYPVPLILAKRKHDPRGMGDDARQLDKAAVTVGFDPEERDDQNRKVQREGLKRIFVTSAGEVLAPLTGSRLRTAIDKGRAAEGQLFGYTHLDPRDAPRYAATIEAEQTSRSDEDWPKLLKAFHCQTLRLGRSAGTSYGGAYKCEVYENAAAALVWPLGTIAGGATRVRVWALSDLALCDTDGAPCFLPTAAMLGLPPGGMRDSADSAIGVRRYAPWNGHLRRRDLERQVIEAGSVFTFTYAQPLPTMAQRKATVGQFQESGLGRILVAPLLLDGRDGRREPGDRPMLAAAPEPIMDPVTLPIAPPPSTNPEPVLRWLDAMSGLDGLRELAAARENAA